MGRLAADLRRVFGADQVFQDVASIDPGADFEDALRQGLQTCAAVLVVIGPDWLAKKDLRGRRRLGLADDWVRREVAESLNDKAVRVSPVLVGNAGMPGADELPSDIQALVRRQAYTVTTRHWAKDVDELVGLLKLAAGLVMAPAAAPSPQPAVAPLHGRRDTEASAPGVNRDSVASTSHAVASRSPRTWMPIAGVSAAVLVAVGLYVSMWTEPGQDVAAAVAPVVAPAAAPVASRASVFEPDRPGSRVT